MQEAVIGSMLGAAIGDALGMPGETGPAMLDANKKGYGRAWRRHPNAGLSPGQFTDDTQLALIIASLLSNGRFTPEAYAAELLRVFDEGAFRFPDAAIISACEHMKRGSGPAGVASTTAGCISIGLPFALACPDPIVLRERLVQACSVTHTNPAAHGGAVSFAMLIRYTLEANPDPLSIAQKNAALEDFRLGSEIRQALSLEAEGISLEAVLTVLGNDVSVYHTLPLACFLIARYESPEELLYTASRVGGNTDTIGFICGAYVGARYGTDGLPRDLLEGLEARDRIESLARALYWRYARKN